MTSTSFQPLSPEQAWITAEGARLYGKEAEQYLQASIRSMNRICRSAQRLMRGIECELKQRNQTSNMTLYTSGDAAVTGGLLFLSIQKPPVLPDGFVVG